MKTISPTPFLPDLGSDEAIPHRRLAYLQERTRNQLFDFVLKKFRAAEEANGLTKAKLARRIHRQPEVITRLLGSPGNWTISTVSDLLVGIAGEELMPESLPIMGPPRNQIAPDWLSDDNAGRFHMAPAITSSAATTLFFQKEPAITTTATP